MNGRQDTPTKVLSLLQMHVLWANGLNCPLLVSCLLVEVPCSLHGTSTSNTYTRQPHGELGKMLAYVVFVQPLNTMCNLKDSICTSLTYDIYWAMEYKQCIASHPMDRLLRMCSLCVHQYCIVSQKSLTARIWSLNIMNGKYGHARTICLCKVLKWYNCVIFKQMLK